MVKVAELQLARGLCLLEFDRVRPRIVDLTRPHIFVPGSVLSGRPALTEFVFCLVRAAVVARHVSVGGGQSRERFQEQEAQCWHARADNADVDLDS